MKLSSPESLQLSELSEQLILDVDRSARIVMELRPLPKDVIRRIEDHLLGERVYSSNALEGNTLDLRETVLILKGGVPGGKKKREATEAKNLGEAARRITEWVDAGESLYTVDRLIETHRLILKEIQDEAAGKLRDRQVMISGAKHQPPDESRIPGLLDQVMEYLRALGKPNDVRRGICAAAWVHWAITRIHPFLDGNGRVARMCQDFVLYQSGLTCAIIPPTQRHDYLNALSAADDGDLNPLIQLVAQRVNYSLERYLLEVKDDSEDKDFLKELAIEADTRIDERRQLSYMRWSRHMLLLRDAFQWSAGRFSDVSTKVQVQVRPFDVVDSTRWQNILTGAGAEKTWFFTIEASVSQPVQTLRRKYYFFFGKHYWRQGLDQPLDRAEQRVSLFVSEDDGHKGIVLDDIPDCPIKLRELFVVNDQFVCRIRNLANVEDEYDRDKPVSQIARDFLKDLVLHRLT